jgi:predicted dehydrogenase
MGMIGGGTEAFIGGVHRMAARLDDSMRLVAGALSSTPARSMESGRALGLQPDRCYGTWSDMLAKEAALPEHERMEAVVIVAPNDVHAPAATAALEAGFHVVCDKPLAVSTDEADALVAAQQASGRVFAVTYNYTGYPMVRQARHVVRSGGIGAVRRVMVEYLQGWLATPLEQSGHKQAGWRTDPARAGAGVLGDIGSHAENLMTFVTGLTASEICSDVSTHVAGRAVEDDASVLLRFGGGAVGSLTASQVCPGSRNGLSLRIWGERGGLVWHQERPCELLQTSLEGPDVVHRAGDPELAPVAADACRLPSGHPEGFIEAFANIYRGAAAAMRAGRDDGEAFGYPDVRDGARGVHFVAAALAASGCGWTRV